MFRNTVTVALVGGINWSEAAAGIAQVMAHFSPKGTLDQRLLEASHHLFDPLLGHRAGDNLVKQFRRNVRQYHLGRRSGLSIQRRNHENIRASSTPPHRNPEEACPQAQGSP